MMRAGVIVSVGGSFDRNEDHAHEGPKHFLRLNDSVTRCLSTENDSPSRGLRGSPRPSPRPDHRSSQTSAKSASHPDPQHDPKYRAHEASSRTATPPPDQPTAPQRPHRAHYEPPPPAGCSANGCRCVCNDASKTLRLPKQILTLENVEVRHRRRSSTGMPAVRVTMTPPRTRVERLRHPRRDEHRTHRNITRRQTLRRGHHVRLQIETSRREPLTTDPAETGHPPRRRQTGLSCSRQMSRTSARYPSGRQIHPTRTDDRLREETQRSCSHRPSRSTRADSSPSSQPTVAASAINSPYPSRFTGIPAKAVPATCIP